MFFLFSLADGVSLSMLVTTNGSARTLLITYDGLPNGRFFLRTLSPRSLERILSNHGLPGMLYSCQAMEANHREQVIHDSEPRDNTSYKPQ